MNDAQTTIIVCTLAICLAVMIIAVYGFEVYENCHTSKYKNGNVKWSIPIAKQ